MKYSLLLLLFVFFSCKNNKPSASQKVTTTTTQTVSIGDSTNVPKPVESQTADADSLYRFVVFFYSQASGAEFELINEYIDSVGVYSQNLGKKIEFLRNSWGREGETDVVMKLRELTPTQQIDFITMSRRVLAKGKFVTIYENYPYKQLRR